MDEDLEAFMKKNDAMHKELDAELEEMMKQDKSLKDNRNQDSIDRNNI